MSGLFALFTLLFLCFTSGNVADLFERRQLLELKNSISDPYDMLSSWKSTNPNHCSWFGVTCNSHARVSELRIRGANFAHYGSFLGNHHSGPETDCSSAKTWKFLSGRLSNVIGDFLELRVLSIPFNRITGEFPVRILGLKNIEVIDIEGNSMTVNLSMVNFTCLKKLRVLNLGFNRFYGKIPKSLSKCEDLNTLNLAPNGIHGPIHVFIAKMKSLVKLNFLFNNLSEQTTVSPPQHRRLLGSSDGGNKKEFSPFELVLISVVSFTVLILMAISTYFYIRYRRRTSRVDVVPFPPRSGAERLVIFRELGIPLTFATVVQATGNFALRNCIGHGGFGSTYRAEISPGTIVAVKRLTVEMCQGVPQFNAEIRSLGRIKHPNLITLIGYHSSSSEMFLVYNYLPGGSLEDFIHLKRHCVTGVQVVIKIAVDVATALAFLHDVCNPRIVHRDVKPSNILLDNDLNAYLSDFGLSRLLEGFETHVTTGVAGTFGYVAPEYALACRVSDKADVYSYGVMLLELISDKRALDPSFSGQENGYTIVSWAVMLWREGRMEEVFAAGMWESGQEKGLLELLQLGLFCTADLAAGRPTMSEVVKKLKQIQNSSSR